MNDELGYLEKIDLISERTGLDFRSARSLLEENDWNLLEALTCFEAQKSTQRNQLIDRVKKVIERGNSTKILIKGDEDTVLELPVTVGILGTVLAPKLALLGAATCLLTRDRKSTRLNSSHT